VTADLSAEENVTISVLGMSAYTWDAVWAVQDLFPVEVGVTTGVVLVFIAIAFKSVLVPLMSVLTGALTVGTVYGVADLIYEHGILDWMGFSGLSSSPTHALLWMCPLLAFSVIIGIGLDYNVFLLVRVREFRQTGVYTTPQAVALGLYRSANVITAAGVIMAIAFSGLLFSNIPSLNEVSLYLVGGGAVRHVCGAHAGADVADGPDARRDVVAGAADAAARGALDLAQRRRRRWRRARCARMCWTRATSTRSTSTNDACSLDAGGDDDDDDVVPLAAGSRASGSVSSEPTSRRADQCGLKCDR
jgi:hypothetical protein